MILEIRRMRAHEGLLLRALRLRALADAPTAFGLTLARERAPSAGGAAMSASYQSGHQLRVPNSISASSLGEGVPRSDGPGVGAVGGRCAFHRTRAALPPSDSV